MSMLEGVFNLVHRAFPAKVAYAHCDIPCGIYDPHMAQLAALTVVRMNQLINDLKPSVPEPALEERKTIIAAVSRYTAVKEEHAEACKRELRILWGDYFRPEHIQQHPDLNAKLLAAMKLASAARQKNDLDAAQKLLAATQEIAEIFWKTKGAKPVRQPSRQGAVGGELVYPS